MTSLVNPDTHVEDQFRDAVMDWFAKNNIKGTVILSTMSLEFVIRIPTNVGFLERRLPIEQVLRTPVVAVVSIQKWVRELGLEAQAEETMEEVAVKKRIRMGKWGVPSSQMTWRM